MGCSIGQKTKWSGLKKGNGQRQREGPGGGGGTGRLLFGRGMKKARDIGETRFIEVTGNTMHRVKERVRSPDGGGEWRLMVLELFGDRG